MRTWVIVLATLAIVPAWGDTQFRVRQMTRNDVPRGKGQCDIRLQVDDEVEVAVHGDMVSIRTISGRDARDDGSECNAPLPHREIPGLAFEIKESRNEIRLVGEPDRRNDYAAIVHIRDSASGYGRYHFRLSWNMDEHPMPSGFAQNNAFNFHGQGRGMAVFNEGEARRLSDVNIDIDRGGKIAVSFRTERGPSLTFTGFMMDREGSRMKASMTSEDGRLRGPMYILVDDRQNVNNITLEATDGRDRMRVNWDRR